MKIIDSFFDTYEKRISFIFIVFFVCSLMITITHFILGISLIVIKSYDDVLSLVDQSVMKQAFLGRNALHLLNIQVLDMVPFIWNIITSTKVYEWIFLIGNILCFFSSKKRLGFIHLLSFLFMIVYIVGIFLIAIHSTSLYHVMSFIRNIGLVLCCVCSFLFIFQIRELLNIIRTYKEALKFKVIIVEKEA